MNFIAMITVIFSCYAMLGCMQPPAGDTSEGAITGVPVGVNALLTVGDIDRLKAAGLQVNIGNTPPDIVGIYRLDSITITFDDMGQPVDKILAYMLTFANQSKEGGIQMDNAADGGKDQRSGKGIPGFVAGHDDLFSVFVNSTNMALGCIYNEPLIVSGRVAKDGLHDLQYGILMKSKTGTNCEQLIGVGHIRVEIEKDGLAARKGG